MSLKRIETRFLFPQTMTLDSLSTYEKCFSFQEKLRAFRSKRDGSIEK